MEEEGVSVPEDPHQEPDGCRLWIGNLDKRLTEFSMLKLLQRYGDLKKFDFLYNKTGPEIGKPRGYCFVSYHTRQAAEKALKLLNGKMALTKKLTVRWAHTEKETCKTDVILKGTASLTQQPESVDVQIEAIEAKLRQMDDSQKDFTLSTQLEAKPGSSRLSVAHPDKCQNTLPLKTKPRPYHHRKPKR